MQGSPPHRIIHLGETASTNKDAMRLALQGERLPLWVRADRQTAGRGRAGRVWVTSAGNLFASVAITCAAPLSRAGALSLTAGIAVIDAIRATSQLSPEFTLRLKWPNDVLLGAAKVGGILVESATVPSEPGFVAVIGIGVNIASYPDNLGRAATALALHGRAPDVSVLLEELANQARHWLSVWDEGRGFDAIGIAWMERAGALGEPISIKTANGPVYGAFAGLSPSGALLVDNGGTIKEFTYGDVALGPDALNGGAE